MKWWISALALIAALTPSECRPQGTLVISTTTPRTTTTTTTAIPPPLDEAELLDADEKLPPPPPEKQERVPPFISEFTVRSDIQFRYARTVVETYIKNPDSEANKLTFSVVLPNKAFISNFSMLLGDEEFVARVETKEDAKDAFEKAVSSGQGAGIVEQDARDANQFVVSASVEAGSKARFRLTYEELLQRKLGRYEQVVFVNPGMVVEDFRVDVYINESLPISHVFVPELKEDPNAITSVKENPFAVVTRDPEDNSKAHIVYKPTVKRQKELSKETGVSGQFIMQYDVDRKEGGNDVQVIDGYFVHFLTPDKLETLPKHIVFVLDVSGSMYGEKLQQVKDAMVTVIDDLTPQDSFNILTFSDDVYHWVPEAEKEKEGEHLLTYPGTEDMRNEALSYVLDLQTIGGTNINQGILDSIEKVKEVQQSETLAANTKPIVIFLTDGQATSGTTNKDEIKKNIAAVNEALKIPIYSLAFGRGADFKLVKEISKENNAFARRIYEGSDAAIQLEDFYLEIASPLLTGLNIEYTGEYVNTSTITNTKVGSFNRGNEIVIAGKLNDGYENAESKEVLDVFIAGNAKKGDYMENIRICLPRPVPFPEPIIMDNLPTHKTDDVIPEQQETDELPSQLDIVEPEIVPLPWPDRCIPLPPRPVEPKSDAQNFIERLWAFLTIKDLLDGKESALEEKKKEFEDAKDSEEEDEDDDDFMPKALPSEEGDESPEEFQEFPKTPAMTKREKALDLALRYNFVTELTSLIVVKPNGTEGGEKEEVVEPTPVSLNGIPRRGGGGGGFGGGCPGCFSLQRVSSAQMVPRAGPPPQHSFPQMALGFGGPSVSMRKTSRPMAKPAPPPPATTTTFSSMAYDADYDSEDDVFDSDNFESESAVAATTSAPKTSCNGTITLFAKTYLRGNNVTLWEAAEDLSVGDHDFNNKLTSLEVEGDCCWKIWTEPAFGGDSQLLRAGKFNSPSKLKKVFRKATSVERLLEC